MIARIFKRQHINVLSCAMGVSGMNPLLLTMHVTWMQECRSSGRSWTGEMELWPRLGWKDPTRPTIQHGQADKVGGKSIDRWQSLIGWPMGEPCRTNGRSRVPKNPEFDKPDLPSPSSSLSYLETPKPIRRWQRIALSIRPTTPSPKLRKVCRPCWRGPACARRASLPAREMAPCKLLR